MTQKARKHQPSLASWGGYLLWLGCVTFGGISSFVTYVQRDIIKQYKWISQKEFKEGLALAQLSPGAPSVQMGIYFGWLVGRFPGATLSFFGLIMPSIILNILMGMVYQQWGELSWIRGLSYGVGACIIALVFRNSFLLARHSAGQNPYLWGLFAINFLLALFVRKSSFIALILSGFLYSMFMMLNKRSTQHGFSPIALLKCVAPGFCLTTTFWGLPLYFICVGFLAFGGGYVAISLIHQDLVVREAILTQRQFLDALAIGVITPGSILTSVAFMGYIVNGVTGGLLAALAIFIPSFILILTLAGFYQRMVDHPHIQHFIDGVSSSAAGIIAATGFYLGRHTLKDPYSIAIFILVACSLLFLTRLPQSALILASGLCGLAVKSFL